MTIATPDTRASPQSFCPDLLVVLALTGTMRYEEARRHAVKLGGPELFPPGFARDVAAAVLTDTPIRLTDPDLSRVELEGWADAIECFAPVLPDKPNDASWALYVLDRLAYTRGLDLVGAALEWACAALGRWPLERVREEVLKTFDLALGNSEKATRPDRRQRAGG